MGIVIVDNKEIPIDIYGMIVGAEVKTVLYSSGKGAIDCVLRRRMDGTEVVIEADMWQGLLDRKLGITNFCASVFMRWEGNRYRIINKGYRDYNDLWRELEILVSNAIEVNT